MFADGLRNAETDRRPGRGDATGDSTVLVNASYSHADGRDRFRGRNVNAPLGGARPDPALGNSDPGGIDRAARERPVNVGMNINHPRTRTFVFANYAYNNQRNDADSAFSLPAGSYDLAAEWGRASGVPRHIASAVVNTNVTRSIRFGVSTAARSAAPYTITTGRDDNGDTVFNDRPAGVGRNTSPALPIGTSPPA